jgi:head-tail adaptor
MAEARSAGSLRSRVMLQQRRLDDNGDRLGDWETVSSGATDHAWWAEILALRGGEPVMAQRLQGVQPVIIAVRANPTTRAIDNAYRVIGVPDRQVYDITAATLTMDRAWVEILATGKLGDRLDG